MKPQIFLGSAAENLSTLKIIGNYLSTVGDCRLWTGIFIPNKGNLENLITQTRLADFSILLAMKGDILIKKGNSLQVTRDNVIFEFGLFLGSTGVDKAFLLVEDGIDLPSDLDGSSPISFTLDDGKYNSLSKRCEEIIAYIQKASKSSKLGLLPSTALALGYYNGFVIKVCEELHQSKKLNSNTEELDVSKFKLRIIIPNDLDQSGVDGFKVLYNRKHGLTDASTKGKQGERRGYPLVFKIEKDLDGDDTTHDLVDIPSTLNTITECMKIYLPNLGIGQDDDLEFLEKRELSNFARTLNYLISKNAFTRKSVVVEENVTLD